MVVPEPAKVASPGRRRLPAFRADPETPPRGFVPIDAVNRLRPREAATEDVEEAVIPAELPPIVIPEALDDWSDRRSLFGDAEP